MNLPGIDMDPAFDRLALSQWHTPPALALRMARWAGRGICQQRIVEPSAGGGALVKAAIECGANPTAITAIEVDPRWSKRLVEIGSIGEVANRDYLTRPARDHRYDLALMNPPYEGGADGKFLSKAMDESDRVIALIRTVALNGDDRHKLVWRRCANGADFAVTGLAFLSKRPDFGGEHGAMADFVCVKMARRFLWEAGNMAVPDCRVEWWAT